MKGDLASGEEEVMKVCYLLIVTMVTIASLPYKRESSGYVCTNFDFGWLFNPINEWLAEMRQIELYVHFVTGVTTGKVFWPQSHINPDVWFTILVHQDYRKGIVEGGDFAFASVGNILKCNH